MDGNVNTANLKTANLDEKWLSDELKKFGVENIKDVLFASLDSSGNLYFQVKEKKGEDN